MEKHYPNGVDIQRSGLSAESVAYRICQDLEARLGIAQGKISAPDYRDYLAALIDERYSSRYSALEWRRTRC